MNSRRRTPGSYAKTLSYARTVVAAGVVAMCIGALPAIAQVTAAISGKIQDSSGAVVGGANITVKSVETGATRSTVSSDSGNYRVDFVAAGTGN